MEVRRDVVSVVLGWGGKDEVGSYVLVGFV